MGKKVGPPNIPLVTFRPNDGGFASYLSLEGLLSTGSDVELLLLQASRIYGRSISIMRSIVTDIQQLRAKKQIIPARLVWRLGDLVFRLTDELTRMSLRADDLYDHLTRDLGVKQKWLEKVVILRRYLPEEELIPQSLNWGRCEKGTRRIAERLARGSSADLQAV